MLFVAHLAQLLSFFNPTFPLAFTSSQIQHQNHALGFSSKWPCQILYGFVIMNSMEPNLTQYCSAVSPIFLLFFLKFYNIFKHLNVLAILYMFQQNYFLYVFIIILIIFIIYLTYFLHVIVLIVNFVYVYYLTYFYIWLFYIN